MSATSRRTSTATGRLSAAAVAVAGAVGASSGRDSVVAFILNGKTPQTIMHSKSGEVDLKPQSGPLHPLSANSAAAENTVSSGVAALCVAAVPIVLGRFASAVRRQRSTRRVNIARAPSVALAGVDASKVEVIDVEAQVIALTEMDRAAGQAEIAKLQLEAARLRAEAADLEAAKVEQQLIERKKWFKAFDVDNSGALDLAELEQGMKEAGLQIDSSTALRLLEVHDTNKDGLIQPDEFNLDNFQLTLRQLQAEERAKEDAKRREQAVKEAEEQRRIRAEAGLPDELDPELDAYLESLPPANEDTSLSTRVLSCLAYLLPLMDSLRFGLPIAAMFPVLQPLFGLVLVPMAILNVIPFGLGQLLLFLGMQSLSGNPELPLLLRFNLSQAIVLDIALFLPNALFGLAELFGQGALGGSGGLLASGVFLLLIGAITYAVACSLSGEKPDGIPTISDFTRRALGPIKPGLRSGNDDSRG
jgi:hypothetical protein